MWGGRLEASVRSHAYGGLGGGATPVLLRHSSQPARLLSLPQRSLQLSPCIPGLGASPGLPRSVIGGQELGLKAQGQPCRLHTLPLGRVTVSRCASVSPSVKWG